MGEVIINIRAVLEQDLDEKKIEEIKQKVLEFLKKFEAQLNGEIQEKPFMFGLKALEISVIIDENKYGEFTSAVEGDEEKGVESELEKIDGIQSAEITGFQRL
jgi:translation elongation factor EF-1beta